MRQAIFRFFSLEQRGEEAQLGGWMGKASCEANNMSHVYKVRGLCVCVPFLVVQ